MQIRNWFDRRLVALFGLLFIVLVSLEDPLPNIAEIINREINLNKARNYNCLKENIPLEEDVLFIGNPLEAPPFSITLAWYYRSQFFLSPRLVVLMDDPDQISSLNLFRYFISNALEAEQLAQIEDQFQLLPVKNCGDFMLLQKQAQQ
jgi:hypothetical protein